MILTFYDSLEGFETFDGNLEEPNFVPVPYQIEDNFYVFSADLVDYLPVRVDLIYITLKILVLLEEEISEPQVDLPEVS